MPQQQVNPVNQFMQNPLLTMLNPPHPMLLASALLMQPYPGIVSFPMTIPMPPQFPYVMQMPTPGIQMREQQVPSPQMG